MSNAATVLEEKTWLLAAQQGDENAFGQLVRRFYAYVMSITYRMTNESTTAEDLAQETFLSAWQNLPRFQIRGENSFRVWLGRIATNKTLDYLRKQPTVSPLPDDELMTGHAGLRPEKAVLGRELQQLIEKSILSLPAQSRITLILREYEGLSYQEIAKVLDIPIGTVMSRLNYARRKLQRQLEPYLRYETGS